MDLSKMSLITLASLCREEQKKHHQQMPYTEIYCVELFRRMLKTPFTEEASHALIHIEATFSRLATSWVRKHWRYRLIQQRVQVASDTFVQDGLSRMWKAFANKAKADEPYTMDTLPKLLAYWKLSIHTAIERFPISDEDPPGGDLPAPRDLSGSNRALEPYLSCLERCRVVRDKKELNIFYMYVVDSMKPRQIYKEYAASLELESVKEVYTIIATIQSRLKGKKVRACMKACIDQD